MTGSAAFTSRGARWWVWAVALLPFLLVALVQWGSSPPGDVTDGYQYLLHARALAEGRGYTDTGYIYSRFVPWVGPVARPPGLPLTLLVVYKAIGPVIAVMQAMMLLCALGYLVIAGRYFARLTGPAIGVGVTILSGLVPMFAVLSTQLLNDLPFCLLFWLTLWVMDRDGPFDWRRSLLVIAVVGAAIAYREAGVALVLALLLYGVINIRRHRGASLVPAAVLGVIGLGSMMLTGVGVPAWVLGVEWHPAALLAKLGRQTMGYRFGLIESLLYPWPSNLANDVYHVLIAAVMLVGLVVWARTSWRSFGFCAAVAYVAMLMVLPATQGRYLWPLEPLVIFGVLRGMSFLVEVGQRYVKVSPRTAVLATSIGVGVGAAVNLVRSPPPPGLADDPDTREVMEWVRPLSGENARVAFFKPRFLTWETRVPAMALPLVSSSTPSEVVVEELERQAITLVVVQRPERRFYDSLSVLRTIDEHPELFEEVRRNTTYLAYRFRPPT